MNNKIRFEKKNDIVGNIRTLNFRRKINGRRSLTFRRCIRIISLWTLYQTRRERLKSALYLRLKKRKVFKIVKMETLWAFWNFSLLQIILKKLKGDPLETKNISKKVAQCRKKLEMSNFGPLLCFPGRPFVSFFLFCTRFWDFECFEPPRFEPPPSCWTNELNKKVDLSCLKKTTHCKSRAHFLLKCAD